MHRIGSAIWSPIRCTGFSECSAPWKTIDASAQRTARSSPQPIVSTSLTGDQHLARSTSASLGCSRSTVLDQRRLAAAGLTRRPHHLPGPHDQVDPAHGRQRPLGGPVGDRAGRAAPAGRPSAAPQPRVEDLLERLADQRERQHDEDHADARAAR